MTNEMPLENQDCTLNQAKKFKELGVTAKSRDVWLEVETKNGELTPQLLQSSGDWKYFCKNEYNAYSAAELWEFFACVLNRIKNDNTRAQRLRNTVAIMKDSDQPATHVLADRIIFSLETKLIKPEELTYG